jgi:hypothetical protein
MLADIWIIYCCGYYWLFMRWMSIDRQMEIAVPAEDPKKAASKDYYRNCDVSEGMDW